MPWSSFILPKYHQTNKFHRNCSALAPKHFLKYMPRHNGLLIITWGVISLAAAHARFEPAA